MKSKILVLLILLWAAGASIFLAARWSPTTDEGIHVASGYLGIVRHDLRFDPEHPPLFKYLTALPVLALKPNLPPDDQKYWDGAAPSLYDSWQESRAWAHQWLYESGNDPQRLIFAARLPAVACFVALLYLLFVISRRWFGEPIALWALFFAAFNPNLLSHGALANNDVPLALGVLVTIYSLICYGENPTTRRALWVSLAMSITLLTKFTGIAILFVAIIWFIIIAIRNKLNWKQVSIQFFLALGVLWVSIWLAYGFVSRPITQPEIINSYSYSSFVQNHRQTVINIANHTRYILPFDFSKGLSMAYAFGRSGRPTYILFAGQTDGVWFYFPVLFGLKTQLVGLILLAFAIATFRSRRLKTATHVIVLTVTIFLGLAISSQLNIGIRHISVLLVLASIPMALGALFLTKKFRWLAIPIVILYTIPLLVQRSNWLGFSNALVGKAENAYQYFSNSNLDWGQHAADIARAGYTNLYTNYTWGGNSVLEAYGIKTFPLEDPLPYYVMIMLTSEQLSTYEYANFRSIEPVDRLGNSVYFYQLSEPGQ